MGGVGSGRKPNLFGRGQPNGQDDTFFIPNHSGSPKFTDDARAYGEIYAYEAGTEVTIGGTGIANKAQINSFTTNGNYNHTTPDHTDDHIIILKKGIYLVKVSISAESVAAGGSDTFSFAVFTNNGTTQYQNVHTSRRLGGGGGDVGSMGMSGLCSFNANDTVEVWVWNEDNGSNVVIDDINLSVVKVG